MRISLLPAAKTLTGWLWNRIRGRPTVQADRRAIAAARDIHAQRHLISSETVIINENLIQIQNLDQLIIQDTKASEPLQVDIARLVEEGVELSTNGDYTIALSRFWQALRQPMDDPWRIRLYSHIGLAHFRAGDLHLARSHFHIARYLAQSAGDREAEAKGSNGVAISSSAMKDWASADAAYGQAVAIYRQMGRLDKVAERLYWISEFRYQREDYKGMADAARSARDAYINLGDAEGQIRALRKLGIALGSQEGMHSQGKAALNEAIQIARERRLRKEEGRCLLDLIFVNDLEEIYTGIWITSDEDDEAEESLVRRAVDNSAVSRQYAQDAKDIFDEIDAKDLSDRAAEILRSHVP